MAMKQAVNSVVAPAALLVVVMLALSGCSKLTQENYNKLKVGMSYSDVIGLLGKPNECNDALAAKSCDWVDGDSHVNVEFVGDKAVLFSGKRLTR